MLPIHDKNRPTITPFVTWMLIVTNVGVFTYQIIVGVVPAVQRYGFLPVLFLLNVEPYRLVTSMFLHGDLIHLGGNMLFLYIFGDNIESRFGHGKFLVAYMLMGFAASATHTLWVLYAEPGALDTVAVGASGAISGVLGAYAILYPHARVVTVIFLRFFIDVVEIPAFLYLGFWFLYQLILGSLNLGGGVAYWAHAGGFVAGALFALIARLR